jgi:TolB-like protein/predicted Ser/Thr protein kinase/Tfp pilus assembly protein PilF
MEPDDDNTRLVTVLSKGAVINHYRIVEKIGAGGMGEVYLADDTELNRQVALKFLSPHLCQDADCRTRFKREAQAAAKLNHPNIVTIYEVSEFNGRPFFAMEHVEGQPLSELIKQGDCLLDKVIDLSLQICEGLQEAHKAGITHRDVKPANILVNQSGRAKLVDFGLASVAGADKLTKEGSTLGTIGYMSPEQVQGKPTDHRSDLFSFGVVLYELVSCKSPFKAETPAATMNAIAQQTPEPLARYKTGVPDELQRIVSKLLQKDPALRYQTAADVISDLMGLKATSQLLTGALVRKDRTWRLAVGVAAFVLLAVAAYGIFKFHVFTGEKPTAQRKMLAVLPFENLGSPDDEYFADGITDEITGKLAAIHELGVISRTSTMQYKKTTKNLRQIAKELGVDYILEGTIRWDKSGDASRVRILPQLIRVSDDTHLWAETYERPMTSIFALQAEIATRIAETMNLVLRQSENAALRSLPTNNLDAYQAYLRGMDFKWKGAQPRENSEMAVQMFERAVALDSTFALAYAELAFAHSRMYWFYDPAPDRCSRSKEAFDRAVALQPNLPNAHIAQGMYYYFCRRDYDIALKELALAEVGLPNDPEVMSSQGYIMRRQGTFQAAIEKLERAFAVSPRDHKLANGIGGTYLVLREYSSAEKFLNQGIYLAPDFGENYFNKASLYYSWRADTGLARAALAMCPNQDNDAIRWQWFWLHVYERNYPAALSLVATMSFVENDDMDRILPKTLMSGIIYELESDSARARANWDSSRVILEQKVKELPEEHSVHSALGFAYAGLGRKDDAIREGKLGVELLPISKDAMAGPNRLKDLAVIYVMVGEYDAALDQIEYLLSIPCEFSVPYLRLDPRYDPLRTLPRYQKLLEKHGT